MGSSLAQPGSALPTYVDEDAVRAELGWAKRFCSSRGWPIVDVTRRSIEETAATILQLMDAWPKK
jgi:regulator of PEP synthase PpsR (kinase-PPPase family)